MGSETPSHSGQLSSQRLYILGDVFLLQVLRPGPGPGRVTGSVQVLMWLLELWIRKQSTLTKFELKFKLSEKP